MERDPVRQKLKDLLWKRGLTMAAASLALGRNRAYMHQYLERGLPKVLNYPDSVTLGELLDCDPAELRHETVPKRKPAKRTRRIPPAGIPGVPSIRDPRDGGRGRRRSGSSERGVRP